MFESKAGTVPRRILEEYLRTLDENRQTSNVWIGVLVHSYILDIRQ